ncbi:MAG: 4Fe-4S binding protein [Oscillospiraceae bacterium]
MYNKDPEVRKISQRRLTKIFPRTEEGFAQLVHAQLYFGYIPLYIYYMRASFNQYLPEPDDLVKPGGIENEIVDELVKTAVNQCNSGVGSIMTNTYHAKVLRLSDAEQIVTLTEDLNLGELPKTIMPYELARNAIIDNPDRIAVIDCVCRNARGEKGCTPRDVCIIIGEPWVSWCVDRDRYMNGRLITPDEALEILRACHERGNVHAAFFKDVAAGRIYSICNCCPCCCTALLSQNYLTAPMMAGSGYISKIDQDKCVGCGLCEKACNFMAIYRDKDNKVRVNEELCRGCEGCLTACKKDAISLELVDASVLAPFDLKALMAEQN